MTSTVELNLGIDFGTRYTKVCVRNTDIDESWVVRIGRARTLVNQGLILSQVAIQDDGKLLGGFTDDEWKSRISKSSLSVVVDFIKMRLAQLDPKREASNWYTSALPRFQDVDLANPDILENLCAYFLYRVIQRSKKWIRDVKADDFLNVEIRWSANIGVPVEYCDSPALERFRRILYLAWHLCEKVPNHAGMTIFDLNRHLQIIRQLDFTNTPCFAVPEIAGAIYSYTASRQAKTGIYIFFDIGGGTIEGVAFRFHRSNGMPEIDFLAGLVEPIGVNAIAKQVVSDSLELESKIERSIVLKSLEILISIEKESSKHRQPKKGEKIYYVNKHKAMLHSIKEAREKLHRVGHLKHYFILTLMMCQLLLHRQVSYVFRTCYEKLPKKEEVSVFLGGGGMISEYYKDTILSTYEAFNFNRAGIPEFKMLDVPLPSDFEMSGIDEAHFHRFSIAYGLSIDHQPPKFNLPRQFPEHSQPPSPKRWTPETSHDDG